jgi:hypothetical protein
MLPDRRSLHKRLTNHRAAETQALGGKIHPAKKSTHLNLPSFPKNMLLSGGDLPGLSFHSFFEIGVPQNKWREIQFRGGNHFSAAIALKN